MLVFITRPLKAHGFPMRLTVFREISQSNDEAQNLAVNETDSQANGIHFP